MKEYNKYTLITKLSESYPLISKLNSKVKSVKIELDFSNNDEYEHNPFIGILLPTDKAFYTFDCINDSCTKGFYNFSNYLYSMIQNNEKFIEGEITCDGWQDKESDGYNRCFSNVSYKIIIYYDEI